MTTDAEREREAEERERSSPVHHLLTETVEVNDEVIRACTNRDDFSRLAFELYNETGVVLAISSHSYVAETPSEAAFQRDQALSAGLLIRISKFMLAVIQLVS